MTVDDLLATLKDQEPPASLSRLARALWLEARGDWEAAHQIAQDDPSSDAAWVHAYLHRKEGDSDNAEYWYGRAGRTGSSAPLTEEWRAIAKTLLEKTTM